MISIAIDDPRSLSGIVRGLGILCSNELPVMTKVRGDRVRAAVREVEAPWTKRLDALIRRHRPDIPANKSASISSEDPAYAAFSEDEDVRELMAEVIVIEVQPLLLSEIVKAEERLDKKGKTLKLPENFSELLQLGLVKDDVEVTETVS